LKSKVSIQTYPLCYEWHEYDYRLFLLLLFFQFKVQHCYARVVGMEQRPPSASEIELVSQPLRPANSETVHNVSAPRFTTAEALFVANAGSERVPGVFSLQDMVNRAVIRSVGKGGLISPELRNDLFGHIVTTGGVSALPGLERRLRREIQLTQPQQTNIHIVSGMVESRFRQLAAWQGAAQVARGHEFLGLGTPPREEICQLYISDDTIAGSDFSFPSGGRMIGSWIQVKREK
jgi:hypothetical protein